MTDNIEPTGDPPSGRSIHPSIDETDMTKTTPEQNKAIVLEAFETLFNKRDYAAAERFWSDHYIQHSAHIAPGRKDCSTSSARRRRRCAMRTN